MDVMFASFTSEKVSLIAARNTNDSYTGRESLAPKPKAKASALLATRAAEGDQKTHYRADDCKPRQQAGREIENDIAEYRSGMAEVTDELKPVGPQAEKQRPEHLLIMVNGLFGHMDNWKVIRRSLESSKKGDASKILMLASNTNLKFQTFQGIDTCGERLAQEIRAAVASQPSLQSISVFGHSMGSLIARHAIGRLFDPRTQKVAGLQPRHFISLASPHLGCGGRGSAEVPFIRWFDDIPYLGWPMGSALHGLSNPFATNIMRQTGKQFFLLDNDEGRQPLLVRMAKDSGREQFWSSLKAFASRTCIANSSGDHLVGWANASIRSVDQLPTFSKEELQVAKGIVRADNAEQAFWQSEAASRESASGSAIGSNLPSSRSSAGNGSIDEPKDQAPHQAAEEILQCLQRLPWCRIDVSFQGTRFPFFAHNLIQVTREWINWEGEDLTRAIADHFFELEHILEQSIVS